MRGLTIIVVTDDPVRWDAALALAASHAALGAPTRLYLHDSAVTCVGQGDGWKTCQELEVRIIACQSGLARHAIALPPNVEAGGLVSIMATLAEDRLISI